MDEPRGAIPKIFVFIIGVILLIIGVPDALGITSIIFDAFKDSPICENNPACVWIPVFQVLLIILGIIMIIGSLLSIKRDIDKGKFF